MISKMPRIHNTDLALYLDEHQVHYRQTVHADGRDKFILAECPFNSDHTGSDAAIFQDPVTGNLGFHCFHDSCADKDIWDVFSLLGYPTERQTRIERYREPVSRDGRPERKAPKPYDMEIIRHEDFMKKDFSVEWLIDGIVAKDSNMVIGGPLKTLKTSLAMDLCLAIASGGKFLGKFQAPKARPVIFVSGESGQLPLYWLCRHVMEFMQAAEPEDAPLLIPEFLWSFKLPKLSVPEHLDVVAANIRRYGAEFLLIDPAYLSLLKGSEKDAKNQFDMGDVLGDFGEMGTANNCTVALAHHFRKGVGRPGKNRERSSLEDLSYSGLAEWARQWMLLSRRSEYNPSHCLHELDVQFGGSMGHSSEWALDVDEGVPVQASPEERIWDVTVIPMEDSRASEKQDKVAELRSGVVEYCTVPHGMAMSRIKNKFRVTIDQAEEVVKELVEAGSLIEIHDGRYTRYEAALCAQEA